MNCNEKMHTQEYMSDRGYLRKPIPEIFDAARYLDAAISAHLQGRSDLAEELIRLADIPAIREWTDSLWGKNSPHVQYRTLPDAPPLLSKEQRGKERMPTLTEKISFLNEMSITADSVVFLWLEKKCVNRSENYSRRFKFGVIKSQTAMLLYKQCGCNTIIFSLIPEAETVRWTTC